MIKFDKPYVDRVNYPIRADDYLQDLCSQVGIILGSKNFLNNDYMILGNPFTKGEDCKIPLMNIAQLALGFAVIEDEKLYIKSLDISGEPIEVIDGNNYIDFSPNDVFGPVNSLKIQMNGDVEGEESVRELDEVTEITRCQICIADNYFLNSQEQRELVIDKMFQAIQGLTYLPVKMNYYGYPWLKVGDKIKVVDKNNNEYITYIMNHTFKYEGKYSGVIESYALTKTQSAYKTTKDIKTWKKQTELKVDKINGNIELLVDSNKDLSQKTSQLLLDVDQIKGEIGEIADLTVTTEGQGELNAEGINESEPILVKIHPVVEDIIPLRPHVGLRPHIGLRPHSRELIFKRINNEEEYEVEYNIPNDLYKLNDVYDEFVLDYENQQSYIRHRIGIDGNGNKYLLDIETTEYFDYPTIPLLEGDYKIYMPAFANAYMYVRLMAKNLYTDQFATKVELNSKISQTTSDILGEVQKTYTTAKETETLSGKIQITSESVQQIVEASKTNAKNLLTEYYLSTSKTQLIGGAWSETAPEWAQNKYMWTRTKITLEDGTEQKSNPVCIAGAKGDTGANGSNGTDGKGVKSIVAEYYISTSPSEQRGGNWSTEEPEFRENTYIWVRYKTTYTDDTFENSEPQISYTNNIKAELALKIDKTDAGQIISTINTIATNIKINGDKVDIEGQAVKFKTNINERFGPYTQSDMQRVMKIIVGEVTPTSQDYEKYDINGSGDINVLDAQVILNAVNNGGYYNIEGSFEIDPYLASKSMTFYNRTEDKVKAVLSIFSNYFSTIDIGETIRFTGDDDTIITKEGMFAHGKKLTFSKVLYDNSSGTVGSVTLSDDVSEYDMLEILYASGGSELSVKMNNPDGKNSCLSYSRYTSGVYQVGFVTVSISGNYISRGTEYYHNLTTNSGGTTTYTRITKVIGYK